MTGEPLRIGVLGAARIAERAIVGPTRTGGEHVLTEKPSASSAGGDANCWTAVSWANSGAWKP